MVRRSTSAGNGPQSSTLSPVTPPSHVRTSSANYTVVSGLERGCLPSGAQEQATNLLAHARCLLEQQASHQHALEQCLAVLQAAPPEAYFFFTLDPPTLTAAAYKRPGSAKARRLRPRFAAALQQTRRRQEALRLNTLSALVRLGVPVALWHFLALTPLPGSVPELAPQPSVAGS